MSRIYPISRITNHELQHDFRRRLYDYTRVDIYFGGSEDELDSALHKLFEWYDVVLPDMGVCALTEDVRVEVTAQEDGISRSDALRRAIVYFGLKIFSRFDGSDRAPQYRKRPKVSLKVRKAGDPPERLEMEEYIAQL